MDEKYPISKHLNKAARQCSDGVILRGGGLKNIPEHDFSKAARQHPQEVLLRCARRLLDASVLMSKCSLRQFANVSGRHQR